MKYPVLYVKSLPNLYKHCTTIRLLHLNLQSQGIQEDPSFVESYLAYSKEQMYIACEAFFVTSMASRVYSKGETFVIFKSNTEKKLLNNFLDALFAELDLYCDHKVDISYQYMSALLFQEGKEVKFFKTGKQGDEVKETPEYLNNKIEYKHDKKPHGKQLIAMDEYRSIYENRKKLKEKTLPIKQENTTSSAYKEENNCEYYI